jgi:hypothetical protein
LDGWVLFHIAVLAVVAQSGLSLRRGLLRIECAKFRLGGLPLGEWDLDQSSARLSDGLGMRADLDGDLASWTCEALSRRGDGVIVGSPLLGYGWLARLGLGLLLLSL